MKFVHQDPEFDELLRIVATKRSLSVALVEKDYEDAARIAEAFERLPPLVDYPDPRGLADEMEQMRQLRHVPFADDMAFSPESLAHARAIERAYEQIGHMYWGPRMTLDEACATIRGWISSHLT